MLDFEEMEHFIRHKMKMAHVYQPLLIKTMYLKKKFGDKEYLEHLLGMYGRMAGT